MPSVQLIGVAFPLRRLRLFVILFLYDIHQIGEDGMVRAVDLSIIITALEKNTWSSKAH